MPSSVGPRSINIKGNSDGTHSMQGGKAAPSKLEKKQHSSESSTIPDHLSNDLIHQKVQDSPQDLIDASCKDAEKDSTPGNTHPAL